MMTMIKSSIFSLWRRADCNRRTTHDGEQADAAADVQQQRYDAELAGDAGDFDEEPDAERLDQVAMHLPASLVRRRVSVSPTINQRVQRVTSDLPTRLHYWSRRHDAQHWATALSRRLQQEPGTLCLLMSGMRLLWSPSVKN